MAFVITDVSEERISSIIMVERISGIRITLAMLRLLVTANVPSSPILVTLMMKALRSSETSAHTRTTRRIIPEDGIFHVSVSVLR
jgi:hypothetical protein